MLENNSLEGNESFKMNNGVNELTPIQMEYLQQTEGMNQEAWEQLSLEQRLTTLNIIEAKIAEIMGRDPMEVNVIDDAFKGKDLVSIENGKIFVKSEGLVNPKKGEKTIGSLLGMSLSKSNSVDFKFPDSQHYNSDLSSSRSQIHSNNISFGAAENSAYYEARMEKERHEAELDIQTAESYDRDGKFDKAQQYYALAKEHLRKAELEKQYMNDARMSEGKSKM